MINDVGWFDFATVRPGPPSKRYAAQNKNEGIVAHSAEGSLRSLLGVLDNLDRRASWTGSIAKNGQLFQHYSVFDSVWTSGSFYPNTHFIAFESEGFAGQPLTTAQQETFIRIIRDCEAKFGWEAQRGNTLFEHNECTRWGSSPTACPSNRYDAVWAALEEDMDPRLEEMIWRMADILVGEPPADTANAHGDRLTALIAEWANKSPMTDAIRNQQSALVQHKTNHPSGNIVPAHQHEPGDVI